MTWCYNPQTSSRGGILARGADSSFRRDGSSGAGAALGTLLGVAGAIIAVGLTVATTAGQQTSPARPFPPYKAPRLADGHPDLNGLWQAFVTANIDLEDHEAQSGPHPELLGAYGGWPAGQSIVEGGEIPYQPSALAKKKQNLENRMKVDVSDDKTWHDLGDPEFKCYHAGRAARDLHAVSLSDRPGIEPLHPDRVRIHQRDAHHPDELEGRRADRFVDGMVARTLGGRHAGRRRDRAARGNVVRSRGRIITATRCTSSSATRRSARIT